MWKIKLSISALALRVEPNPIISAKNELDDGSSRYCKAALHCDGRVGLCVCEIKGEVVCEFPGIDRRTTGVDRTGTEVDKHVIMTSLPAGSPPGPGRKRIVERGGGRGLGEGGEMALVRLSCVRGRPADPKRNLVNGSTILDRIDQRTTRGTPALGTLCRLAASRLTLALFIIENIVYVTDRCSQE